MKKLSLLLFTCTLLTLAFSCKKDKKTQKTTAEKITANNNFVIKPEATKVEWIGYKTTDKVPVKGQFNTLNFETKSGASVNAVLNDLEFSIPISSLFTNNPERDNKLKTIFFGAMANTSLVTGKLHAKDTTYSATLTMNGVTKSLPLKMTLKNKRRVKLNGVINLENWDALNAVAAINKACFDLHKGKDGVSKTWNEVAVEINTFLRKE